MTKLRNRNKTKRRHHVTKRRSHRHRTRSQKGGDLLHTISLGNFGTPDVPVPVATGSSDTYWSKFTNYFSGPTDLENAKITDSIKETVDEIDTKVGEAAINAKNVIIDEASVITEKAKSYVSGEGNDTLIGSPYPTPSPSPPSPPPGTIGGKTRKHKNRKGGSNLGLLYYATPVEQTILIKGGKKHKHTCCKGKSKGKRHRHSASCSRKK